LNMASSSTKLLSISSIWVGVYALHTTNKSAR
jgi:hypothetical protein